MGETETETMEGKVLRFDDELNVSDVDDGKLVLLRPWKKDDVDEEDDDSEGMWMVDCNG